MSTMPKSKYPQRSGSYYLERKTYSTGYRILDGRYTSKVAARKAAITKFNYDTRLVAVQGGGKFLGIDASSGKPMYEGHVAGVIKRAFQDKKTSYVYIWCDYDNGMKRNILNKDGTLGRACPEYKEIWNQLG